MAVAMSTPETQVHTTERRKNQVFRVLYAWFFDTDLDTLEKVLIGGKFFLSAMVLVLNARILAAYPPLFQGFILAMPAPIWSAFFVSFALFHLKSRARIDFCGRRNAALATVLAGGALSGNLITRAPSVLVLVVPGVLLALIVSARLSRLCKEQKETDCGECRK